MTYTKPELVALTHAVEAIQGSKPMGPFLESIDPLIFHTACAYEADE